MTWPSSGQRLDLPMSALDHKFYWASKDPTCCGDLLTHRALDVLRQIRHDRKLSHSRGQGMEESMSLANEVTLRDIQDFCVLFEAQGYGLLW